MKKNLIPVLVAGALGGLVLWALVQFFDNTNAKTSTYLGFGFLTGVLVQVGVRVIGVS